MAIGGETDSDLLVAFAKRIGFGGSGNGFPAIIVGFGEPTERAAQGSIYLRQDAPDPSLLLYVRQGGLWVPLSTSISTSPWQRIGTTVSLNMATDLVVAPAVDNQTALGTPTTRWLSVTVSQTLSVVVVSGASPTSQLGDAKLSFGTSAGPFDTRMLRGAPSGGVSQIIFDNALGGAVNLIPAVDGISKIGTRTAPDGNDPVTLRWAEVNAVVVNTGDLNLIDEKKNAHWTIIEEHDRILVLNRKSGEKFAMALTPIADE